MNNLKLLSIAGLLAGSMSANAAFIVDLPERVSFDINAPISSFTLDHVYDLDWDNPNTYVELVEHNISIGGFVDLPPTESFPLDSFYGPEGVNDGLKALLFGRLKEDPNNPGQAIRNGGVLPYVELGRDYLFIFSATAFLHDLSECETAEYPQSCPVVDSIPYDSTWISFFDSTAVDVPVGPTAPLLAAGLVGLWLRRKQA